MAGFPQVRLRRLRRTKNLRKMVRETSLTTNDLIQPLFVIEGRGAKTPIKSMPGQYQFSLQALPAEISDLQQLGILSVILFGIPAQKDNMGTSAYSDSGVIQQSIAVIKKVAPDMVVITDICLCEYTNHGHCGVLDNNNSVDNDATLDLLAKIAVSHAKAGADIVAPSAMMDGQIGSIRKSLDAHHFENVAIMAYAAKFASAFFGPFREAAESTPQTGDRKSYQMNYSNSREALRELEMDAGEGADILMVKPALSYLDILSKARQVFSQPLAAYNVSGEYSMVKAAIKNGWLDGEAVILEILAGIKRAGADLILTYHAKEAARLINDTR